MLLVVYFNISPTEAKWNEELKKVTNKVQNLFNVSPKYFNKETSWTVSKKGLHIIIIIIINLCSD